MKPRTEVERREQEGRERVRQIRGLVWLAVAAVVFAVARAGGHRVFTPGWWRFW
ncbi:hypothetical protein [Granulicella aggregans]|uniref:hypothetical protein n=1 Tax=Granulicella aggregans TaxID=474949 RepID=UPI0021DF97D1|nr:hypothetical protein [Granulicella aggregans]